MTVYQDPGTASRAGEHREAGPFLRAAAAGLLAAVGTFVAAFAVALIRRRPRHTSPHRGPFRGSADGVRRRARHAVGRRLRRGDR